MLHFSQDPEEHQGAQQNKPRSSYEQNMHILGFSFMVAICVRFEMIQGTTFVSLKAQESYKVKWPAVFLLFFS